MGASQSMTEGPSSSCCPSTSRGLQASCRAISLGCMEAFWPKVLLGVAWRQGQGRPGTLGPG